MVVYLYDALKNRDLSGKVVVTNHVIFELFKTYFQDFKKDAKKEMLVNLKTKLTEIANFYIEKLKKDDGLKETQYKKVKYRLKNNTVQDSESYTNTLDGCSYNHIGSLNGDDILVHQNPMIDRKHKKFMTLTEPNVTMCKIQVKSHGRHIIETMQDSFRFFVPVNCWILKTPFFFFNLYRDNKIVKDINLLAFACVLFSQFPFICHVVEEKDIGLVSVKMPLDLMWSLYNDSQKLSRTDMCGDMKCFYCDGCFLYKKQYFEHECLLKESVIVFSPLKKERNIMMFDGMVLEQYGLRTGSYKIIYNESQFEVRLDTTTLILTGDSKFYDMIMKNIYENPLTVQTIRIKIKRPMVDMSSCEKYHKYGMGFMHGLGIDGTQYCKICNKDSFYSKKYDIMPCGHRCCKTIK